MTLRAGDVLYEVAVTLHLLTGETLTFKTFNPPSIYGVGGVQWTEGSRTVAVPFTSIAYAAIEHPPRIPEGGR